jgi:hypothetical protein
MSRTAADYLAVDPAVPFEDSPRVGVLLPSPRLLNLRQAAAYLGVSFWSVRDFVLAGFLPTVSLPPLRAREGERRKANLRRVLIDRSDLDAFSEKRKCAALADR